MADATTPVVADPSLAAPSGCSDTINHSIGYSGSWAGHLVTPSDLGNAHVTSAWSTWTQPSVPSSGTGNIASVWVGTGYNTLSQTGVDATAASPANYAFWIQDWPYTQSYYGGPAVSPGQQMYATVSWNGSYLSFFDENQSTGGYLSSALDNTDGYGSADYIVERVGGGNIAEFSTFSEVSDGYTTANGSYDLTTRNQVYYMSSYCTNQDLLAAAGPVNNNGGFTMNWYNGGPNSTCSPNPPFGSGG